MTLEEFAANLRQDVLVRGSDSPNYEVDVFTEDVIETMPEAGEADGFILCNCDGRGYKINAYNVSSDEDCIDLFVTIYTAQVPLQRVPAADIDRHLTRLRGFFKRALTDNFRAGLEESLPEFDAADSIHAARNDVTRGRLFLRTDGLTSARDHEDVVINGINFTHHVWDIERIFRMQTSGAERKRWKVQHPVSQKFTKTDLAKFEFTWDQKPYTVSRGAEKNFVEFMAALTERHPTLPDEACFRHLVAKAILFRQAEKLVQAQNYGGYRANIVTYTLAWLSHRTAQKN